MIRICVIGVYFGTFPNYFRLWLKSCEVNQSIDFFIVTDNEIDYLPSNVHLIKMTLKQLKCLAENKLDMKISLDTPYKCCDYKPVYGVIFEDYIKSYQYWGHCDFDLIFGDLRFFVEKHNLEKYDKFLPLGHLAFYRNTPECNQRFRIEPKTGNSYKKSFSMSETTQFDELGGINAIYHQEGFPFFSDRVFVDVSINWNRIKCAEKYVDPFNPLLNSDDKNYRFQLFIWENGKVLRKYINGGELHSEEFAYIHIKKRKYSNIEFDIDKVNSFIIGPHDFTPYDCRNQITKKIIQKYNHNYGTIYEFLESKLLKKIQAKLKKLNLR